MITENYTPPPRCIEVLEWLSPEIIPDFPAGVWSLEALREWLNEDLPVHHAELYEAAMEAAPETLGTWVAEMRGYPVRLIRKNDVIVVPSGPFRVRFAGGNKITGAINRRLPGRSVSRLIYWVVAALCFIRFLAAAVLTSSCQCRPALQPGARHERYHQDRMDGSHP